MASKQTDNSPGFIAVDTLAALQALPPGYLQSGGLAFVRSSASYYAIVQDTDGSLATSTAIQSTANTAFYLLPLGAGMIVYPAGVTGSPANALDWYVDGVGGNDANSGIASGAPLKTLVELGKRRAQCTLGLAGSTTVTVHIQSAIDSTDLFTVVDNAGPGCKVTFKYDPLTPVPKTGVLSSIVATDPTSNARSAVTPHTGFAPTKYMTIQLVSGEYTTVLANSALDSPAQTSVFTTTDGHAATLTPTIGSGAWTEMVKVSAPCNFNISTLAAVTFQDFIFNTFASRVRLRPQTGTFIRCVWNSASILDYGTTTPLSFYACVFDTSVLRVPAAFLLTTATSFLTSTTVCAVSVSLSAHTRLVGGMQPDVQNGCGYWEFKDLCVDGTTYPIQIAQGDVVQITGSIYGKTGVIASFGGACLVLGTQVIARATTLAALYAAAGAGAVGSSLVSFGNVEQKTFTSLIGSSGYISNTFVAGTNIAHNQSGLLPNLDGF